MSDTSFNVYINKKKLREIEDEIGDDAVEIDGIPMDVFIEDGDFVVYDTTRTGKRLGRVTKDGKRFVFDKGKLQDHKRAGGLVLDKEERLARRKRRRQEEREQEREEEGQEALRQELSAQRRIDDVAVRRQRRRQRVKGSWRDQGRGNCYTRTNKNGGAYVVCEEGSRGQKGVYQKVDRKDRGDPDQKGRDKSAAIKKNRAVLKKYDDEGRLEDLEDAIYYTPIKKDGGDVLIIPSDTMIETTSGQQEVGDISVYSGYNKKFKEAMERHPSVIRVPLDKFNAQYRTHRGLEKAKDRFDDLVQTEYELQTPDAAREGFARRGMPEDPVALRVEKIREAAEQVKEANINIRRGREREESLIRRAEEEGGGFTGLKQAVRKVREARRTGVARRMREDIERPIREEREEKERKEKEVEKRIRLARANIEGGYPNSAGEYIGDIDRDGNPVVFSRPSRPSPQLLEDIKEEKEQKDSDEFEDQKERYEKARMRGGLNIRANEKFDKLIRLYKTFKRLLRRRRIPFEEAIGGQYSDLPDAPSYQKFIVREDTFEPIFVYDEDYFIGEGLWQDRGEFERQVDFAISSIEDDIENLS